MPLSQPFPSSPNKNATAIAAAAAVAKKKAELALLQRNNNKISKYYAAAIAGLIVTFTIFHWCRFLYSRYAARSIKDSRVIKTHVSIARATRHVLNRRIPGFTSVGHACLVAAYLSINIVLTVTKMELTVMNVAKRLGWIAILNTAFITFLALKNTPLAYLTGYSYESLNPLHQIGGYTTIISAFLHATLQCVAWKQKHRMSMLLEKEQINGITAACAMLVILITALLLRKITYELFYVTHILMYMLMIITVAMHRPDFATRTIIITILAGSMWASDRIFRGSRVLWNSINNKATVYPLPHGGTRIVLRRSPSRTIPGTHCFLWIPKLRLIETHPFTIISATPTSLDLVIASYDGFTSDLHNYAVKNPGASLRASIDGPYGALPNFGRIADKVILIAGGSGASFTFGVALNIINKVPGPSRLSIDFVWSVREPEMLSWFRQELNELRSSPRVNLFLYTTRPSPSSDSSSFGSVVTSAVGDEKPSSSTHPDARKIIQDTSSVDVEKSDRVAAITPWDSTTSLDVATGRPDVDGIIQDVVSKSDRAERIAIAACGPESMMKTVRRTAAKSISVSGASIELHCEQFGW